MRKLFKDAKKSGLPGFGARRQLKITIAAIGTIFFIAGILMLGGGPVGISAGVCLALSPFIIPAGEFSENEKKGLQSLADYFTEQFKEFEKGLLSEEKMMKRMEEKLKDWGDKNGISEEKMKEFTETLRKQGESIKELAENPIGKRNVSGLKKEFIENYDKLRGAVKNKQAGFVIKADPDVSDNSLLHSRENIISTATNANLVDNLEVDPQLYMKRRDRQYIHDIADVSYVAEVPEAISFDEEGDENGYIAIVDENGLKPQVQLKLIRNKTDAKKAAGFIVVTEETMKWRTRVWAWIQRLFRDKVYRDYENQLTDDLLTNTAQYIGTPLDGTITAPNDFDAIIAVICQLEQLNFEPDTLVMNPSDKWKTAMTTTTTGAYILPYLTQGGQFKLLSLNVITTNKVTSGEFIVGESGIWKIEEEMPRLRTALVNDDALHNRMTIIGEIFFLSYVPSNNAGGFVRAKFSDVKEALTI
ncbi:MAG: phage major capsid protein [Candidatus Azobacteroides sp.]|nr:phage major capsid protein [Candidatus Azobacteroides sp.]